MCPPTYFDTHFLFNPWMEWREAVDQKKARKEWEALRRAVEGAGAEVLVIEPSPDAPAMAFTRDGAIVIAPSTALLLVNDGPRGDVEPGLFGRWFEAHGFSTETVPYPLEGGNLLPTRDGRYLVGMPPDSAGRGERYLARTLERRGAARCVGLPLAHRRHLHLDTTLNDLGGRAWLAHRPGLGEPDLGHPSWRATLGDRPVLEVDEEEAKHLACNVVLVDDLVVAGWLSPRLRREIEGLGLDVLIAPLDEFRKAGGGAHCLTLELEPVAAPPEAVRRGAPGEGKRIDAGDVPQSMGERPPTP